MKGGYLLIAIIDIGGTNIKYGVIDSITEKYQLLGALATDVHTKDFRMEDRLDVVLSIIKKKSQITGIAISSAGIVDEKEGKIIYANKNIPNYKGTNIKAYLENKYRVPVTVENDVNAALLGELHYGAIKSAHSALMLTIGTGVGGALYLENKIHHGYTHSAGEVGYSIINGHNIEATASTSALVRNVQKQLKRDDIDGRWIFQQAMEFGDSICEREIQKMLEELALLVNNYVALINPEYVILGGGIMEQEDYLQPLFLQIFEKINTNELTRKNTKIRFASLGNKAGMLGAYVHYKKQVI